MKITNNFPKLTKLDNIENELTNKAPIDHASTTTTYGGGTASNYGHVKLSDSYTSSAGAASASVAASSKAVADAYAEINSNLALWQCWDTTNKEEPLSATISLDKIGILVVSNRNGETLAGIFMIYPLYIGYVQPIIQTLAIYRVNESLTYEDMFKITATNDYVFTVTPTDGHGGLQGWFIVK